MPKFKAEPEQRAPGYVYLRRGERVELRCASGERYGASVFETASGYVALLIDTDRYHGLPVESMQKKDGVAMRRAIFAAFRAGMSRCARADGRGPERVRTFAVGDAIITVKGKVSNAERRG